MLRSPKGSENGKSTDSRRIAKKIHQPDMHVTKAKAPPAYMEKGFVSVHSPFHPRDIDSASAYFDKLSGLGGITQIVLRKKP